MASEVLSGPVVPQCLAKLRRSFPYNWRELCLRDHLIVFRNSFPSHLFVQLFYEQLAFWLARSLPPSPLYDFQDIFSTSKENQNYTVFSLLNFLYDPLYDYQEYGPCMTTNSSYKSYIS